MEMTRRIRRAGVLILAFVGAWYLLITFTPIVSWWARALAGPWPDAKGAVLIVLGSDTQFGIVGEASYWRAFYAARLIHEGGWQEVVVSGGAGVGEAIRDLLVYQGVPREAVRVEAKSGSTRENASFTAELLAGDRRKKVLLTSDYHMFRAIRAFRKAGLAVEPQPIPHVLKRATSWTLRAGLFFELAVETVKIVYYGMKGWI